MGKETLLAIPPLPTTAVQGFGGYHAAAINENTHNLFEEIPSLGIAGDMVMALASQDAEPTLNFHIGKPPNSDFTTSLAGKFYLIGPRHPEIGQRLAGFRITGTSFTEYVAGTRFHLRYLISLSDILGNTDTFRTDKIVFENVGMMGGETHVIHTRPSEIADTEKWYERNLKPTSAAVSATAEMGVAYCFGFQLYKDDGPGETRSGKVANWSCVTGTGRTPFEMPDGWYNNRNDRRNLPDGIGTERFRAISMRQDLTLMNVVRRKIKTNL
ncbi:uncharacterized protein [Neodiprion pinetum]|uniref:Uncharacterized protein LOC107218636 n=1 Tax=Neodiprion lecontei TaxID=441921 RepID=A0A6J0BAS9_NEOLC|nr:uncharacterized protein LOC107218636 [Neodiprion lecontei]XP_046480865.1 uncharacterized protein LOC124218426 [Neodiprion pinetum]